MVAESWQGHVDSFVEEMKQILVERGAQYNGEDDSRFTNFDNIARIWSVILGIEVTPRQVALCNIGQKLAREVAGAKHDSMVDIANFAIIADNLGGVRSEG